MAKNRYLLIFIVCICSLATSMLAGCVKNPEQGTPGGSDVSPTASTVEPSEDVYTRDGNYIYFGSYPQSEVTDDALKATLTNAAGDTSTWTSYDYYIRGYTSDFMVYKDVSYNGEKYRGIYFTQYRPIITTVRSSEKNSYQDDYRYYTNTVYWFKYEPIKWKILSESNGDAFLCSELILDSQDFHYTENQTNGYYANNYEKSHIRAWLNDSFYNTAFTAAEKNIIKTTVVDNSESTTGDSSNLYACNNTNDKVLLLSYSEVTNSSYGFNSNYYDHDSNRVARPTSYAMAQGVWIRSGAAGWWWLRSHSIDFINDCARSVNHDGSVSDNYVGNTIIGVVPALHLTVSGQSN